MQISGATFGWPLFVGAACSGYRGCMSMAQAWRWVAAGAAGLLLGACGGGGESATLSGPTPTVQESQCLAAGWQRLVIEAGGLQRTVLWKAPAAGWTRGAVVVLHGGGGQHANFCVANVSSIGPQVRFTEQALAQGHAVFLPDSSDRVSDNGGRLCGKVWDDEVRARPNLDLPFLEQLLRVSIPALRPAGSRAEVFMVGHSSGGYMTVRAATRLPDLIKAFAPVASGDPYGWFRDCSPRATDRVNVFGAGFDSETRRQIIEPDACAAASYPNEQPWDGASAAVRPAWRAFHHVQDGINDLSCVLKVSAQLRARGYPETPALRLDGGGRSAEAHAWQDGYNAPVLDFFAAQLR